MPVEFRAIAAALLAALALVAQPIAADPPRLAVIIVVDQMRADYVDRFAKDWTGGLKRFVTSGARFTQAAYPYLTTVTCAGHATISTGAFPHTHGVFQNSWWDREARKQMTCTEDPRISDVGYGTTVRGGDSAWRLQLPTFTDRMRTEKNARIVTLALKDRSAVMLAGHGADAVTWMSDSPDGWLTGSTFSTHTVPAVDAFLAANRMTADFGKTWSLLLPPQHYQNADDAVGEAAPPGWTKTFPHPLRGTTTQPDRSFVEQWQRSPFADAYIGRFAAALVDGFQLGRRGSTDVLGVSFSSPDLVGHAFGPRSWEMQDMYAQLDRTLGRLFDHLDRTVGRGKWVAALTADHGVTPIPEQLTAEGRDAGRVTGSTIANAIEEKLRPALGPGRHVTLASGNDIYLEPGVYDRLLTTPELMNAVVGAISAVPGVRHVFRSEEVRDAAAAKDPLARAAALSYVLGRSGDLLVALKPGWMFSATGTTHGSANPDDQHVPVMLLGAGVKPGSYDDAASPADVAPTLALLCGITMPQAEGHPLKSAVH